MINIQTIFFTFSAADAQWEILHQQLYKYKYGKYDKFPKASERYKLLNEYPYLVGGFFIIHPEPPPFPTTSDSEGYQKLCSYLKNVMKFINEELDVTPKTILCHGTRRGLEQQYIIEYFENIENLEVIGTEISYTATQFPNTIEWDFHEVKDEWIGNVDIMTNTNQLLFLL